MLGQQRHSKIFQLFALSVLITGFFLGTATGLSDKRRCADENCKTIISIGRGLISYPAGEEGMVSFKANSKIRIMSKSAGTDPSVWGVEVGGRVGYAPKTLIKEDKILVREKDLTYLVDVVLPGAQKQELPKAPVIKGVENNIEPKTTPPFENANTSDITVNSSNEVESNPASVNGDNKVTLANSSLNGKFFIENASDLKVTENQPESTISNDATKRDRDILNRSADAMNNDQQTTPSPGQTENVEVGTTRAPELNESVATNGSDHQQNLSKSDLKLTENPSESTTAQSNDATKTDGGILNSSVDATNNDLQLPASPEQTENAEVGTTRVPELIQSVATNGTDHQQKQYETKNVDGENYENKQAFNNNNLNSGKSENIMASTLKQSMENNEKIQSPSRSLLDVTSKPSSETISIPANNESTEETERKKSTSDLEQRETSYNSTVFTNDANPNETDNVPTNEKYANTFTDEETIVKHTPTAQTSVTDNENILYPANDVAQNADGLPIPAEKTDIYFNKSSDNPISGTKEESSNKLIDVIAKPPQEIVRSPVNDLSAEETVNESPSKVGGVTADPNQSNKAKANEIYLPTSTVENEQSFQQSLPDYKSSFYPVNDATQNAGSPSISAEQNDVYSNQPSDNTISYTNSVEESSNSTATDLVPNESNTTQQFADKTNETETERQEIVTSEKVSVDSRHQIGTQAELNTPEYHQSNENQNSLQDNPQFSNLPSTTPLENNNYEDSVLQTTDEPNSINNDQLPIENDLSHLKEESTTANSVQESTSEPSLIDQIKHEDDLQTLTSSEQPIIEHQELDKKENRGLFATIMDTVNNMLPNNKKHKNVDYDNDDRYNELDRILFSESLPASNEEERLFCEKLDQNNCPISKNSPMNSEKCECSWKSLFTNNFTLESFLQALASKILEISELIAFLAIVACSSLFFIFGYYCFCKSSSEGALLSKLNQLESSLLASHQENVILKQNLLCTKQKLSSIEDNSFGTNDMVVSLKKELEEELLEKGRLQEQIVTLQKELENAADAGIELNKIVSELLSNQTGDESIISSVEELQRQLNEQQNTILEINASLAEKSRENSELQLMIAEQHSRYETQLSDLQLDNDELEAEKGNLRSRLDEIRADFDKDITAALESKNFEIKRLQNEIVDLNDKFETEHAKWQTCMAKIEALEECLKSVKRNPNVNINQLIDVANIKADLLDTQKKYNVLKDRMELELDARKLAESQLQSSTAEIEKIKQDFHQTEKDKLEAQTRLEVLSNYFKEKENQLQKELSLKETMRLKQQGETTTTVDRLTTMQEEIHSLKSQNDALRAEIEAQVAAHKAQTGTLENRAHETWLAARQSDRRFEEARAEATALRRKLTALAGGAVNEIHKNSAGPAGIGEDLANAPSPILMETTGSPILGRMPPPPFLPPPFMGPPPPFMGMPPPPPFVPPGEIRPAPLGRILSPPPQRSGRLDFDDYLDYEGSGPWHRHHTYSPPPRTYRSLSPTDSRYNYGNDRDLISTYDTETDFSPPPSPRGSRRRGGGSGSEKEDYKFRHPYNNSNKSLPGNKDPISSGSDNSSFQAGKTLKSSGGKFLI